MTDQPSDYVQNPIVSFLSHMGHTNANISQMSENNLIDNLKTEQDRLEAKVRNTLVLKEPMKECLARLDEQFFHGKQSQIFIVAGMAGDGKTHLLIELLSRHYKQDAVAKLAHQQKNPYLKLDQPYYENINDDSSPCLPPAVAQGFELYLLTDLSNLISGSSGLKQFQKHCFDILTENAADHAAGDLTIYSTKAEQGSPTTTASTTELSPESSLEPAPRRIILAAANYGALLNLFEDYIIEHQPNEGAVKSDRRFDEFKKVVNDLKLKLLEHNQHLADSQNKLTFFDTQSMYQPAQLAKLVHRVLEHPQWDGLAYEPNDEGGYTLLAQDKTVLVENAGNAVQANHTAQSKPAVQAEPKVQAGSASSAGMAGAAGSKHTQNSGVLQFITQQVSQQQQAQKQQQQIASCQATSCANCFAKAQCPILHNRNLLLQCSNFIPLLTELFTLLVNLGLHLTPRNTFLLVSNALLGYVYRPDVEANPKGKHPDEAESNEPLPTQLSCTFVREKLAQDAFDVLGMSYLDTGWASNPFDNLLGLNLIKLRELTHKETLSESAYTNIFAQFRLLKLGQTNSYYFENKVSERLELFNKHRDHSLSQSHNLAPSLDKLTHKAGSAQAHSAGHDLGDKTDSHDAASYRMDNLDAADSTRLSADEIPAEERSLLAKLAKLQEDFVSPQNLESMRKRRPIQELIAIRQQITETSESLLRYYFFMLNTSECPAWSKNAISSDSLDGMGHQGYRMRFELCNYRFAYDYLVLLKWAKNCETDASTYADQPYKSNNPIYRIYAMLKNGLYCILCQDQNTSRFEPTSVDIPLTNNISKRPSSIVIKDKYQVSFATNINQENDPRYLYLRAEDGQPKLFFNQFRVKCNLTPDKDLICKRTEIKPEYLKLPLRLQDFEFLCALGSGMLPQSMSSECNSRFAQFKGNIMTFLYGNPKDRPSVTSQPFVPHKKFADTLNLKTLTCTAESYS